MTVTEIIGMLLKISPLQGGRIMAPAEISRFFAGRDTVWQHMGSRRSRRITPKMEKWKAIVFFLLKEIRYEDRYTHG